MAEDRLYDLAFAFKNTKLWEKLSDLDLFAVRLPGGEIGYCCVMGQMGDHLDSRAIGVWPVRTCVPFVLWPCTT